MRRILSPDVALSLVVAVLMLPVPALAGGRSGPGHFGGGGFHGGHFRGGHHFHGGHFRGGHFHNGHHRHFFGGFAAGVFTGAIVGSAFAPIYSYPAPVYTSPAPAYVAPPPSAYWYYCRSAGAYYPYVPSCPEGWMPVLAQ